MKKVSWEKISAFEGPKESLGFLLWKVSTDWRRQIESALATLELTHPQFVLLAGLSWLTRESPDITQVDLARHCGTDINMTSQILRTLENKGYVERLKRPGNERSKFPRVTLKGVKLLEKAVPLVESVDLHFFEKLGSNEAKCLEILKQLS